MLKAEPAVSGETEQEVKEVNLDLIGGRLRSIRERLDSILYNYVETYGRLVEMTVGAPSGKPSQKGSGEDPKGDCMLKVVDDISDLTDRLDMCRQAFGHMIG